MKQENKQLEEKPIEELEVAMEVGEQEPTEEIIEAEQKPFAETVYKEDVLALLDRARTSLARKAGNTINVPTREVRALINGLIADVSALKGEK